MRSPAHPKAIARALTAVTLIVCILMTACGQDTDVRTDDEQASATTVTSAAPEETTTTLDRVAVIEYASALWLATSTTTTSQ